MPSSQRDQLAGNEAKITVEVFLSSPHQVYIVDGALSSIYIISSTIAMNQYIFSLEKMLCGHFKHPLPGSLMGDAEGMEWAVRVLPHLPNRTSRPGGSKPVKVSGYSTLGNSSHK